jgi:CheY-like chemotaxis protein
LHEHALAATSEWVKRLPPIRILLAEDNEVNHHVVIGMAERFGCTVQAVRDGQEAVEALDYERHDLILMDVQMPRMDGFAATLAIRQRERSMGRHIPIIAMTAHAMQGDRERCLAIGMDGYITKPIRPGVLRDAIRTWGVDDPLTTDPTAQRIKPGFLSFSPEILGESCGNDPELACEVLGLMLKGVPAGLDGLEAAVRAGEGRQVSRQAHSLKGTFLSVGAEALVAACQELISLGERGEFALIQTLYRRIRHQWESLAQEANRYLAQLTASSGAKAH